MWAVVAMHGPLMMYASHARTHASIALVSHQPTIVAPPVPNSSTYPHKTSACYSVGLGTTPMPHHASATLVHPHALSAPCLSIRPLSNVYHAYQITHWPTPGAYPYREGVHHPHICPSHQHHHNA